LIRGGEGRAFQTASRSENVKFGLEHPLVEISFRDDAEELLAVARSVVVPLERLAALLEKRRHRHGVACCSSVIASGY
jgi:hypothetical protein